MSQDLVKFSVSDLSASVPEGLTIEWRGREFASGPLTVELAPDGGGEHSHGVLDYGKRRARAEFYVQVGFPRFAEELEQLEVDRELTRPVRAVIRSEGAILDDHSFVLSGACDIQPHALLPREKTAASVLPGQ
jgi:hypothetical protein